MQPALHVIAWPGPGRLATTAHPWGAGRLAPLMAALADAHVDVLVSTLTVDEQRRLAVTGAEAAAAECGMEYVWFPIPDHGVPAHEEMIPLAVRLAAHVRAGRFVVTQCLAAIGRATLLAGAVLVVLGVAPADALDRISTARGVDVPSTRDQERWLYDFADAIATRPAPR
jgi:protein-tyrosine phosphatase